MTNYEKTALKTARSFSAGDTVMRTDQCGYENVPKTGETHIITRRRPCEFDGSDVSSCPWKHLEIDCGGWLVFDNGDEICPVTPDSSFQMWIRTVKKAKRQKTMDVNLWEIL